MSQENVELMRSWVELFNCDRDVDAVLDQFYAADAVYHSREDEPDTGTHRGREAIRGLFHMWLEMFPDLRFQMDDYIDAGDAVVMPGWICATGHDSATAIRQAYTWVARIHNGRVVEVREYHGKDEGLEAVGLEE